MLLPTLSHAQQASGSLKRVASACQAETARFCPAQAQSAPSPQDQLICLRPYKTSLSFNCRAAINAMSTR